MEKRKILVLFGNIAYYGQERVNLEILNMLRDYADYLFLTHHKWGHLNIEPQLEKLGFKYEKIKFIGAFRKGMPLKMWIEKFSRFIPYNVKFLYYYKKFKPDLIYVANDFFLMTLFPALVFVKKPILFNIGDKPIDHYKIYDLLWRKFIAKKVSFFTCVSKFIKHSILKKGVLEDKTKVVYAPIPQRDKVEPIKLPEKKKFRVVYFGQIIEIKGIPQLIEAAEKILKKYDDIEFLIAGKIHFTNPYSEKIVKYVKEKKLDDKIIFLDYVEDIDGLLQQSDVHIAPSIKEEPLGVVVFEAKKNKKPSIIFNSGGLPEMVTHLQDGYICKEKTADCLVKAIEFFHNLEDKGKQMGLNAYESLKKFPITKEQIRQNFIEVIEKITQK